MRFEALVIPGAYLVHSLPNEDDRGWFVRHYDQADFAAAGLCTRWGQSASSFNRERGILRGLHYQAGHHPDIKLVRCCRGALWDVLVDLRPESQTYGQWAGVEMRPNSACSLYIPAGCAHGYQVLEHETEVSYLISEPYLPEFQRGLRWNDPTVGISWPLADDPILSERDRALPFLESR